MLTAICRANEKNNILDVFLTNNDQLTRQIIIIETSMSDHNIIQIETNIKIVEEKQNHQIKQSNLSCRGMNFFRDMEPPSATAVYSFSENRRNTNRS